MRSFSTSTSSSTATDGRPRARVRGLGDLAAVVPYLLGFTPHESLTCLAVLDGRVGLAARLDLGDVCHLRTGDDAVATMVRAVARTGAPSMLALITSEHPVPAGLVERLQRAADVAGLALVDVGWQRGGRCRSVLCDDPVCCPSEGVPIDASCQAAAAAAYSGALALPDRAAVAAEFDRPSGLEPSALEPLIGEYETRAVRAIVAGRGVHLVRAETRAVLEAAAAADRAAAAGETVEVLSDRVVARLVTGLSDVTVRDAVWLALDSREVHGEGLWLELARRAPSPYDASPLFLLGWRSWRAGDGVRALLAAERAAETQPGYSAAQLLLDAISACVDPRTLPRLSDPAAHDPVEPAVQRGEPTVEPGEPPTGPPRD